MQEKNLSVRTVVKINSKNTLSEEQNKTTTSNPLFRSEFPESSGQASYSTDAIMASSKKKALKKRNV